MGRRVGLGSILRSRPMARLLALLDLARGINKFYQEVSLDHLRAEAKQVAVDDGPDDSSPSCHSTDSAP